MVSNFGRVGTENDAFNTQSIYGLSVLLLIFDSKLIRNMQEVKQYVVYEKGYIMGSLRKDQKKTYLVF